MWKYFRDDCTWTEELAPQLKLLVLSWLQYFSDLLQQQSVLTDCMDVCIHDTFLMMQSMPYHTYMVHIFTVHYFFLCLCIFLTSLYFVFAMYALYLCIVASSWSKGGRGASRDIMCRKSNKQTLAFRDLGHLRVFVSFLHSCPVVNWLSRLSYLMEKRLVTSLPHLFNVAQMCRIFSKQLLQQREFDLCLNENIMTRKMLL